MNIANGFDAIFIFCRRETEFAYFNVTNSFSRITIGSIYTDDGMSRRMFISCDKRINSLRGH